MLHLHCWIDNIQCFFVVKSIYSNLYPMSTQQEEIITCFAAWIHKDRLRNISVKSERTGLTQGRSSSILRLGLLLGFVLL